MKAKKICNRVFRFGPGGWKCPCCGPAPAHRRKARQQLRRKFHRFLDKIEKVDAQDAE